MILDHKGRELRRAIGFAGGFVAVSKPSTTDAVAGGAIYPPEHQEREEGTENTYHGES